MSLDGIFDQLLEEGIPSEPTPPVPEEKEQCSPHKRERIAALAAGGRAQQYLGRAITAEQVDSAPDREIERLYARYECRLGAAMTRTLGAAALQLYATAVGTVLPIPPENKQALVADLESDPFVEHALSSATCALYHRYGMYLAPLTAALTTARHCQFERNLDNTDDDVRGEGDRESDSTKQ